MTGPTPAAMPTRPAGTRRRALPLALATLLALAGTACSPAGVLNSLTPGPGLAVTTAAYGPGPRHGVDIYRLTAPAPPRPVIVFLYGGNWQTGAKDMYAFVARPLAERGAIVVVPDYRLAPQVAYPDFVQDCADAVAWTLRHAAELGGDPARVFVVGHSAGAYNAVMLTLNPVFLRNAGAAREQLAGTVGLAGPYDFLSIYQPDLQPIFAPVGNGPLSQPITFADGHNPPLLLIAGTDDTTVQPRNTRALAARITALGGPVSTRYYPGIGHIGLVTAFAPLFRNRAPVLDDVLAFVTIPQPRT